MYKQLFVALAVGVCSLFTTGLAQAQGTGGNAWQEGMIAGYYSSGSVTGRCVLNWNGPLDPRTNGDAYLECDAWALEDAWSAFDLANNWAYVQNKYLVPTTVARTKSVANRDIHGNIEFDIEYTITYDIYDMNVSGPFQPPTTLPGVATTRIGFLN